jgi:hypothetical protein
MTIGDSIEKIQSLLFNDDFFTTPEYAAKKEEYSWR